MPESMREELQRWNNGSGIDLESWVACSGNFSLAVGYSTLFWPEFERNGRYILRRGATAESIRSFEAGGTPAGVEAVLNHIHLADLQHAHCDDVTADKLLWLGQVLREIHQVKLAWQFPDDPCEVDLVIPENREDLREYQITFWQKKWGIGAGATAGGEVG